LHLPELSVFDTPRPEVFARQHSVPHSTPPTHVGAGFATAHARRTPWYVWTLGAMTAVGIGVAGAWYFTQRTPGNASSAPRTSPPGTPDVAPVAVDPPPVSTPQLVELRFASVPAAAVFADGHSPELCRTPCAFDVDLHDGGPTDKRTFVVRADGYQDKQIVVALAAPEADRDLHVTLDRASDATPADPKPVQPIPAAKPHASGVTPAARVVGRPAPHGDTKAQEKPEPIPAEPKPGEPKPGEPKPRIPDATDTLDPFHGKP
jgi:hypothetical protein